MELITEGFDALGRGVSGRCRPGTLRDLIVNGAIAGVAAVVMFLPQILSSSSSSRCWRTRAICPGRRT